MRRHDNNSSHCFCIPTCQGLPRYYFYFCKLLCIWIIKLRDSLFKKKKDNERGGREGKEEEREGRNSHITETRTSLSCGHTDFLTALQTPQACACPGAFALALLSVWNAPESESQARGPLPACSQQRLHHACHSSRSLCRLTLDCFMVPEQPLECQLLDGRDFCLFCSLLYPLSSE